MRSLTAFVSTAALVLFTASGASAQARPDFSGTWTFDPASAPAAPGGRGSNPPRQITVTQDAHTFTISWTQDGATFTQTYNLDGSESGNQDGISNATWEDDRLVIVTRQHVGGNEIEQRRVVSLDGGDLVVELPGPSVPRGDSTVVRLVFTKR